MDVAIIGAPVDLGADRRGVDMGASAIRYAGLEGYLKDEGHNPRDFGNISVPIPETTETTDRHLKYLQPILHMTEELAGKVSGVMRDGYLPLVLGGDHAVSLGSVAGVARERTIGIIWVDAHGDFNTPETSPSGNIHGMVLAALAGIGDKRLVEAGGIAPKVAFENIVLVGTRELDPGERSMLREKGVRVFTMHDIDRLGLGTVMAMAAEQAGSGVDGIHLSLDLDVVDPLQAPGVGTPVIGGLNFRETHLAMEMLAQTRRIISIDLVEVNPILDTHNATADLATQFALSALGKTIL
jgi:arginase